MSHHKNAAHVLAGLLEEEKAKTCGEQSRHTYLDLHRTRFSDILRVCQSYVPDRAARVLDIGRSELTAYLLNAYDDIHTLGFDPSLDDGGHRESRELDNVPHILFNLLDSQSVSSWPQCGRFDLIVFSEVIEHLGVAPECVLALLHSLLTDRGILVCTTPNAADISKRIRLAAGRNPYERLRLYANNPGHIREYTRRELDAIARSVGLACIGHSYFNWGQHGGKKTIRSTVMRLLRAYPPFSSFQMCVLARAASASR